MNLYNGFRKVMGNKLMLIIIITVIASVPVGVQAYKLDTYNKLVLMGQKALLNGQFEEADKYFTKALKYNKKDSNEINKKIADAKKSNVSKVKYEEGIKFFGDRNYTEAIEAFKMVSSESNKYYSDSQVKINEAKKLYASEGIEQAKANVKNKKYSDAISLLDLVLKVDPSNKEVEAIKEQYIKELQKAEQENLKKTAQVEASNTTKISNENKLTTTKTNTTATIAKKKTTSSTKQSSTTSSSVPAQSADAGTNAASSSETEQTSSQQNTGGQESSTNETPITQSETGNNPTSSGNTEVSEGQANQ